MTSTAFRAVAIAGGVALGGVVAGAPGGIAGAVGGVAVPVLMRRRAEARRAERAESQLAGAISAIADGLRSGRSLAQAVAFAAGEVGAPVGPALREVADRSALGVPLTRSLHRLAEALPGPDARIVVGVLGLHHRTGGDLPSVLEQLARTLRERRAAAREVRSLTAQARLSGAILGFLPIGFFLFLSATSRSDIAAAYHSTTGAIAIGLGLAMQAAAFVWIRHLLRVRA
jgi:tight adherence protein B